LVSAVAGLVGAAAAVVAEARTLEPVYPDDDGIQRYRVGLIDEAWRRLAATIVTGNAPWFLGRVQRLVDVAEAVAVDPEDQPPGHTFLLFLRCVGLVEVLRQDLRNQLLADGLLDLDDYLTVGGVDTLAVAMVEAVELLERRQLPAPLEYVPERGTHRADFRGKPYDADVGTAHPTRVSLLTIAAASVEEGFTWDDLRHCYRLVTTVDEVTALEKVAPEE
jgi:hypothetical protein